MKVTDFNFELPQELIAQDPLEDRASSRLLVLDKETGEIKHRHFRDILRFLHKGDCLVINDTKVIPARLMGHKEDTGAAIEVLLLKRKSDTVWETLVKPGKKMKVGARVSFGGGLLKGTVTDVVEEGNRLIQFEYEGIFEEILDQLGQMPLPRRRPGCILQKNCWRKSKGWGSPSPISRSMLGWAPSARLRWIPLKITICIRNFTW